MKASGPELKLITIIIIIIVIITIINMFIIIAINFCS